MPLPFIDSLRFYLPLQYILLGSKRLNIVMPPPPSPIQLTKKAHEENSRKFIYQKLKSNYEVTQSSLKLKLYMVLSTIFSIFFQSDLL